MKKLNRPHRAESCSPLAAYFREVSETPLLSAEEESQLAQRIQKGDREARDRMVRANLRLVVNIARGYTGKGLELLDLIEEGNLGLLHAVEKFDPSLDTRFSTYARYWIKQSIVRTLIAMAKPIRLPMYVIALLSKWRRVSAQLEEKLGRQATPEEVAARLQLSPRRCHIIEQAIQADQLPLRPDQDNPSSQDAMPLDRDSQEASSPMIQAEEFQQVLCQFDKINAREAAVLRLRFGLDDHEPRTLTKIGQQLHLTRERVRQIERRALTKIRKSIKGSQKAG